MLKHNPKLKKLWRDCEVLSAIAGSFLTTKAFDDELVKVIQRDVEMQEEGRVKSLISYLTETEIPRIKDIGT